MCDFLRVGDMYYYCRPYKSQFVLDSYTENDLLLGNTEIVNPMEESEPSKDQSVVPASGR
jgi:hypothetical protein